MPGNRFDLSLLSHIQSRDGGTSKGALTVNGFVEYEGTVGWAWQRPGLGSRTPALATGAGLGFYVGSGNSLWGVYAPTAGTTTSGTV